MDTTKPIVLIIEDNQRYQNYYQRGIVRIATILAATSIEQATELWELHKERISLVVVDGCVPGENLNTLELTRTIRSGFQGPIIAASSSKYYRKQQIEAGCNHEVEDKMNVPAKVIELLGASQMQIPASHL